ncbi:MAG: GNAT family N-acetyltransferase [Oscillospiraceae bacterium]|nr:GNAT family N-acetyltransferase [Oscillospiraceae bacterium]
MELSSGGVRLKTGQALIIRQAETTDAQEMLDYLNAVGGESDNLLFGENEFRLTVEQEEQFIEKCRQSQTSALFVGRIEGELVCVGSVLSPERARIAHNADVAISVRKQHWGLGIGSHLMDAMIAFAKGTNTLEVLHLGVREDNRRAIALYEKNGFQEIGCYPKYLRVGAEYHDNVLMNLYL